MSKRKITSPVAYIRKVLVREMNAAGRGDELKAWLKKNEPWCAYEELWQKADKHFGTNCNVEYDKGKKKLPRLPQIDPKPEDFKDKEPLNTVQEAMWVKDNIERKDLSLEDIPSMGAWTLLKTCMTDPKFKATMLQNLLPTRQQMDKEGTVGDVEHDAELAELTGKILAEFDNGSGA